MNPTYAPRLLTDVLLEADFEELSLGGEPDRAARYIEKLQLLRPELWELFVNQFRTKPDNSDNGWRGEYWGKMMRGACLTYKYTKNPELYALLEKTVYDMMSTADESGRISAYRADAEFVGWDMWARKYVILGMQYFYDICKSASLKAKLLESMCAQMNYIISKIGEGEGKLNILESSDHWGGLNSCTVLEPVVRLYNLTGDKKYFDFASYIVKSGGCKDGNIFELALKGECAPFEYPVTKAYEMMSFFEGVIEYYRVSGDERCRTAFLNFVNKVIETDVTVIGCCGCTHELFDNSREVQANKRETVMQETCVSVTWMKTCYQALCLTGDSRYADQIEKTYYNAMLGSVNFEGNLYLGVKNTTDINDYYLPTREFIKSIGGLAFDSYSPLYKDMRNRLTGGYKVMEGGSAYGCCACIGSAGTAILPISAVMLSRTGVVFNHYVEGSFKVKTPSGSVAEFRVNTKYPYDGKIEISWKTEDALSLELRIPEYVPSYKLNGDEGREHGYITYKAEGTGSLVLELKLETVLSELSGRVSLRHGIITYAFDERNADIDAIVSNTAVSVTPAPHDFNCRGSLDVLFDNGTKVRMTDYASAGAAWNSGKAMLTVWMDTEKSGRD